MITIKLDLAKLKHSVTKMQNGNEVIDCIVLPIEMNKFFKSDKGAIYLDLIAFEVKNKKDGQKDTHMVKQSLSKEEREAMSEEEQRAMPILGNMRIWDNLNENSSVDLRPVEEADPLAEFEQPAVQSDDLPF